MLREKSDGWDVCLSHNICVTLSLPALRWDDQTPTWCSEGVTLPQDRAASPAVAS